MCGTKNFASVRLYSAPQSHWTIVAILGICAFGEPVQAGSFAAIKVTQHLRQPPTRRVRLARNASANLVS